MVMDDVDGGVFTPPFPFPLSTVRASSCHTDARDGWPECEMLQMSLVETARLANSMFLYHFFSLPVRSFFPPFLTLVDKRFISVRSLRSVPKTNGLLAGDVPIIQGDGG